MIMGEDDLNREIDALFNEWANGRYADDMATIRQSRLDGALSNGLSIAGGLTDIISNTQQLMQTGDTTPQRGMIGDIRNLGNANFSNYDQLVSGYEQLDSMQPDLSWDAIRGGSTRERLGNVLSSTMTGVTTGMTVGGIPGAIAGGVIGLGSGVGGWLAGDNDARLQQQALKTDNMIAKNIATKNLAAASEGLRDYTFRSGVVNRAQSGGQIRRKQETVKEFAERIFGNQRQSDVTHSARIVRQHCNGGTMVRIKR